MLDTPDVRQAEDYNCGPAAMDCALRCLGIHIKERTSLASPIDGTHPSSIETALRVLGLNVCSGTMTVADLRNHTRLGRPVLCATDLFGGHWVVARGVQRSRVYYHCPVDGRKSKKTEDWLAHWQDHERTGHRFINWGIALWNHEL